MLVINGLRTRGSASAKACTKGSNSAASGVRNLNNRPLQQHSHNTTRQHEHDMQRDLILSVLESHPSARDSRFYLKNFGTAPNSAEAPAFPISDASTPTTAFTPTISAATGQTAVDPDTLSTSGKTAFADELMMDVGRHTALVKIQGPFSDRQLESIAEGMVYLKKLGLVSIIVLDNETWYPSTNTIGWTDDELRREVIRLRERMKAETLRFVDLLEAKGGEARPLLEGVLAVSGAQFKDDLTPIASASTTKSTPSLLPGADTPSDLFVDSLSGIRDAIRRGEIPVIPPIALDENSFSLCVNANDAVRAISSGLADHERSAGLRYEADAQLSQDVDLTPVRIMVINREGGIPSPARGGNPHLSINLASEFEHINRTFVWQESHPTSLANLALIKDCLAELPRTASGVVVSHRSPRSLIANLITNKPAHSPSLHHSLLPEHNLRHQPTIVRPGLPIRVFRKMSDVDKPKLTVLLEASFGKTLDADPFYDRLERDLDFCIVAGDYQGVAIVTNELPADLDPTNPAVATPPGKPPKPIAYLDKFAVLPSLQGDGTVDFLWGALRDESFGLGLEDALNPNVGGLQGLGVGRDLVWRSRSNNPVNKWYFERSNGFLRVPPPPGTSVGFALFWCEAEDRVGNFRREVEMQGEEGTGGDEVTRKLREWSKVCGAIPGCWAP